MPVGVYKRNPKPLAARFWESVDKDGPAPQHLPHIGPCWLWTGAKNNMGYGLVRCESDSGKWALKLTHRVSWEISSGEIPGALCVLHRCDTPLCVRPAHLFLGTKADNMADKVAKGRQPRGEKAHHKLTSSQVEEIRALYAAGGVHQKELARRFCISRPQMCAILNGRSWGHLKVSLLPGDGRQRNGKLKPEDVERIRTRYAEGGITFRELSAEYGVCQSLLCGIVKGKRWVSK